MIDLPVGAPVVVIAIMMTDGGPRLSEYPAVIIQPEGERTYDDHTYLEFSSGVGLASDREHMNPAVHFGDTVDAWGPVSERPRLIALCCDAMIAYLQKKQRRTEEQIATLQEFACQSK